MGSIFKVTPIENKIIHEYKEKAITALNEFFEQKWIYNTPKIFIVDDRNTINLLNEKETERWVVGWSWGRCAIFILNPEKISKESSHDKNTYKIEKLIKHELCHSFFQKTFGQSKFGWINEGVSIYVADQLENNPVPKLFKGFIDGTNIYQESGHVIKLLIENYGKENLFNFLRKQSGIDNSSELNNVFEEVYKEKLEYSLFNRLKK